MKMNNPMFGALEQTSTENTASLRGVMGKTGILLAITFISAFAAMILNINSYPILLISSIIGMIALVMGRVNARYALVGGIVYSACEGIFLGTLAGVIATFEGLEAVVPIAIVATMSIFIVMLVLYSTKVVAATPTLYKVLYTAGSAIVIFMLLSFVLSLFGSTAIMDLFYGNTTMAAVLCILFICYGSFMLVLNFNEIEIYAQNGFDKSYEWVAALGLIVSLIYIYIQIVRLLLIIMSRRD